jgi:hypothetical protein
MNEAIGSGLYYNIWHTRYCLLCQHFFIAVAQTHISYVRYSFSKRIQLPSIISFGEDTEQ